MPGKMTLKDAEALVLATEAVDTAVDYVITLESLKQGIDYSDLLNADTCEARITEAYDAVDALGFSTLRTTLKERLGRAALGLVMLRHHAFIGPLRRTSPARSSDLSSCVNCGQPACECLVKQTS